MEKNELCDTSAGILYSVRLLVISLHPSLASFIHRKLRDFKGFIRLWLYQEFCLFEKREFLLLLLEE